MKKHFKDMLMDMHQVLVVEGGRDGGKQGEAQEWLLARGTYVESGGGRGGHGREGGGDEVDCWPAPASRESSSSGGGREGGSGGGSVGGMDMRVTRRELDALGFLLCGGEEGMEGRQVRRLSSLVPFWRKEEEDEEEEEEEEEEDGEREEEEEEEEEEGCAYILLHSWLEDVLCVNQALYPPPPDPFVGLPPLERQAINSLSLPLPMPPLLPDAPLSFHHHKPTSHSSTAAAAAAASVSPGLPPSLPPSSRRKRRQVYPPPPPPPPFLPSPQPRPLPP